VSRTLSSPRHHALARFIRAERKNAGLTQADVAKQLRRYQSFVAAVEMGQRRIDVVELLDFATTIGFDARDAISAMLRAKQR
jgi:transcriptional regulator with XRE-family HTH domain